jgi:hypothetical protein
MPENTNHRQPPTPAEVQERLNRMYGATVPPPTGSTIAKADLADVFTQYADAAAPRNIVGKLLKFSKGDYVAGEGGEEVPEGTQLVAIMDELWVGWTRWQDGKPTESRIGRLVDSYRPAQRRDLGDDNKDEWPADDRGDARDPWQFANYLVMKNPETGEFYTFTTGTRGGLNTIADLCRHYARDVKANPGYFPIVALRSDSYNHPNRAYGRIKIPVLAVVGRAPCDGSVPKQSLADDMNDEIPDHL